MNQSFAQEPANVSSRVLSGIDRIRVDFPEALVQIDTVTELPRSISGLARPTSETALAFPAEDPADIVRAFFVERGQDLFVMAEPLQETRILSARPDPNFSGQWVVRVQQHVGDVLVFGAQAIVDVQPGVGVLSLRSAMVRPPVVEIDPKISEEEARRRALVIYQGILAEMSEEERADIDALEAGIAEVEAPVLTIFDSSVLKLEERRIRLSWQVRIGDFVIFVDSLEGSLVYS